MDIAGWTTVDAERGAWYRSYVFDRQGTRSNAFLMRLRDGLAVVSPSSTMSDEEFAAVDAVGPVTAIVAPSGYHHLGQPTWQTRYPEARCFAPADAAVRIGKKHQGLRPFEPIGALSDLVRDGDWIGEVPGMRTVDTAARVGSTWYFNDVFMNIGRAPANPLVRLLFWATDSGPGFKVSGLTRLAFVNDKRAYKAWLSAQMHNFPPTAMVVGHGRHVDDGAVLATVPEMIERAL
jgi:hypothetical protein